MTPAAERRISVSGARSSAIPFAVTGGLVMDPGVNVLVTAPVGGAEPARFPQEAPDVVGCQLHGQVIVEEVAQARDHVVGRGVNQCPGVRAQGLAQALLVDVPGGHPLEPPPRLFGGGAFPGATQRIPRCFLVPGRDERRLRTPRGCPAIRASSLSCCRCEADKRREELTARVGLLRQARAEGRDDPAGNQSLDGPFFVYRLLPLDLRVGAGSGSRTAPTTRSCRHRAARGGTGRSRCWSSRSCRRRPIAIRPS